MFHRLLLAPLMVAIGLTWVHDTYAATMTVICSPPKGFSFFNEMGKEMEVVTPNSGFPGTNPTFVIEGDKNETALVVFGSARIPNVIPGLQAQLFPTNAERATIVISNDIQISMTSNLGDQVWTYSLYPKHGYGLFSYHGKVLAFPGTGEMAVGGMYQSKCQFSWK